MSIVVQQIVNDSFVIHFSPGAPNGSYAPPISASNGSVIVVYGFALAPDDYHGSNGWFSSNADLSSPITLPPPWFRWNYSGGDSLSFHYSQDDYAHDVTVDVVAVEISGLRAAFNPLAYSDSAVFDYSIPYPYPALYVASIPLITCAAWLHDDNSVSFTYEIATVPGYYAPSLPAGALMEYLMLFAGAPEPPPPPPGPPWPVSPSPPSLPEPPTPPIMPVPPLVGSSGWVLPYLKIPTGQGQSVNELDGQSSISSLDVECIDPSNQLKYLSTKPEVVGRTAILKMGFEGMNLSDFVPIATGQISNVARTAEGWMQFSCRDSLAFLDRALWYCGGPQPVALPWLYGQAYLEGQYVQDSNGNIQLCTVAGVTSPTQPPVWPGTVAKSWSENTSYTLGFWATDSNGNLQQVTTVPAGSTSTRKLNTGESGNGSPRPSWSNTLGGTTLDDSGGTSNGPITWTLIAIAQLGQTVTDGTVTWELVAMPSKGLFGGSQAFYIYSLFAQSQQVPQPPASFAYTSNEYPTIDSNPRYLYGNPLDILLIALQNELGLGQDPALPPIITTDPNNPQNALVFAPNPNWTQYTPGDDTTLINPNPFLNVDNIISLRDNEVSGRKFEWAVKRPVTAKSWIQDEILKPLGLYLYVHADGSMDLKSMKSPVSTAPAVIDGNTIMGIPDEARLPIVNVMTVRCDVNDEGAYSAARVYDAEMTFVQKQSLATYLQEFSNSSESNGMRLAYDSYGVAYLLADRIFRRHAFATPEYTIKVFLGWVRLELGDFILLSHPLMMDYKSGNGQLGISSVLCEIVDRQPDYANGSITLKVWDTRFMQLSKPYDIALLTDAIPNWTAMTAAQRAKYVVVSYWPGYYSDGAEGNEIY